MGSSEIGSKRVREKQKRRLYNKTSPKKKRALWLRVENAASVQPQKNAAKCVKNVDEELG